MSEFGPPEVLVASEVPDPAPGEGQALIDVELANITFVETQVRAGRAPNPAMVWDLPVIPGNGVGGVVAAVGAGVDPALVGTRVVSSTDWSGAYAERVAVDAAQLVAVPDGLGMREAVALLADGRTATLLVRSVGIRKGETVLVEAAGGGVGSLLVQLARNAGARVVAAAGDDRKLELARELGAHIAINYRHPEWADRVKAELGEPAGTDGEMDAIGGVDLAFDGVGGAIGRASFDLVRDGGRFFPFGMASGAFVEIPEDEAARRQVTVVRIARPTPEEAVQLTRTALTEAAAWRLRPVIGQTFPLEDAARAHAAIESRATTGKTLLVVRDG
jgi:NADPH2:quinone reductase